jgi:hypothetical protein
MTTTRKPNPWQKKTTQKSNPFLKKAGTKRLRVGQAVKLAWKVDAAYGGGVKKFTGDIIKVDDWITVCDSHDVIVHMPVKLCTVQQVKRG